MYYGIAGQIKKSTQASISNLCTLLYLLYVLSSVVIDQTSFQNNSSLIICKITQPEFKCCQSVTHHISCNTLPFFFHRLTDLWNKQIVAIFKGQFAFWNQKWQHTPVYQIRTVSFGSVLGRCLRNIKYLYIAMVMRRLLR